jgi:hypothetical protein
MTSMGPPRRWQTPTLRDPDRLAERVCVPGDPGAPGEVDVGLQSGRRGRGGYLVDGDRPGKPIAGSARGVERVASDLNGVLLISAASAVRRLGEGSIESVVGTPSMHLGGTARRPPRQPPAIAFA